MMNNTISTRENPITGLKKHLTETIYRANLLSHGPPSCCINWCLSWGHCILLFSKDSLQLFGFYYHGRHSDDGIFLLISDLCRSCLFLVCQIFASPLCALISSHLITGSCELGLKDFVTSDRQSKCFQSSVLCWYDSLQLDLCLMGVVLNGSVLEVVW